jgi:uncharacterized protein (DUF849 family)
VSGRKVIISCAITGSIHTPSMSPHLPVTAAEIAEQALAAPEAGAANQEDVMHMKRTADRLFGDNYRWSVLGAGRAQMPVAAIAASIGGNVRVGLEDSLWIGAGKLAASNAEQVTQVRKIIEGLGLDVATADEARDILELKGGDKVAF